MNVYRDIKALNVELSDEVRGVMDRMIATGEQIQLAEQGRSMMPLFASPDQAGMTLEEFAAYQALGIQATADAIEDLQARGLRDLQWVRNARSREMSRLQKEADTQRAQIRAAGYHTGGDALDGLNRAVHWLLQQAAARARANGRRTLRAHDFILAPDAEADASGTS